MRPLRLVLALGFAPLVLSIPTAGAAANFGAFRTPTGEIGCAYDASFVRCDVVGGIKPRPHKPKACTQDWGQGFELGRKGAASVVCAGDTALGLGGFFVVSSTSWHRPGLLCVTAATSLRCNNTDGHGFYLSKMKSYQF